MPRSVGATLLVVEYDDPFRRSISDRLRLERYRVLEATREMEARRIIQRIDIDVVLLGMVGAQQASLLLLRAIKEIRPLTEVILLSLPGEASVSVAIEGMKLGAFDDLLVPFDVETLLERINAALERKAPRSGGR